MEPITAATVAPALLKAGVSLATGPAKAYVARRTVRRRVASASSREAEDRGIRISKRAIRLWLARADVQDQLRAGTASSIASATANLAWLIEGVQDDRERQAAELLFVVLIEFLRAHDPADAAALSAAWIAQQVASEAQDTRIAVEAGEDAILGQLSAPQVFASDTRHLHPWRRAVAEEIVGVWPAFAGFVNTLVSASDRGAVLREWQAKPPAGFSAAPAEAWCWFGLCAGDHAERVAAAHLVQRGAECGAVPRSYWLAQAAMYAHDDDPQLSEALLADAAEPHPLKEGLQAIWQGQPETAIQIFSGWEPETAGDRATKASFLSQCLAAQKELNRAIDVALRGAEDQDASGVAILAADLLLSRARHGPSDSPLSDSNHALALAVRSRNARRLWAGDSATPTLVAIKAAAVSGDLDRAWELSQPSPDGDATQAEASDPRIRREAAVLSAMTGRLDRARRLAMVANDPYINSMVDGFVAQQDGNEDVAAAAWHRAFAAAPDDTARLSITAAMAEIDCELPDLTDLEARYPEQVRELRSLHELLPGGEEGLPVLRARAHENPRLAVRVAEIYSTRGDHADAARALEDSANRWNDPQLLKMAADRYQRAGDHLSAERCAESSITLGGSGWAGEFEARTILLRAHEDQGHREDVIQQARRLVVLDPNDADARWALVHCLVRAGDTQSAWSAMTPNGTPVQPRDPHDARTWISLMARYDESEHFVSRALTTMGLWPDDETLLGIFIAQIYSGLRREALTPTEADLGALHQATSDYLTRFPESSVFRAYSIAPGDDPLAGVADELRDRYDAVNEISNKVRSGELPLGALASATGRSYAEAAIRRAAGSVLSHSPHRRDQAAHELGRALDRPVVWTARLRRRWHSWTGNLPPI